MFVRDIYNYLNTIAPFNQQDKYDNSGLIVGSMNSEVRRICFCLDVTREVAKEAEKEIADLIISHHPVIFDPLKKLEKDTALYTCVKNDISIICTHTCFDVAPYGVTDIMLDLLNMKSETVLEPINANGTGYGRIVDLDFSATAETLAVMCKKAFDCKTVRYYDANKTIARVAVCSGSGNSVIKTAIEKKCDALIAGDISWSKFIDAKNAGLSVIDAGHFYTENILCSYLLSEMSTAFPDISMFLAENSKDIVKYL